MHVLYKEVSLLLWRNYSFWPVRSEMHKAENRNVLKKKKKEAGRRVTVQTVKAHMVEGLKLGIWR
jgi:hypothetical protein